ncbi:hypothetical protein H0H93_008101 [Arthromyces matolae]|nr:hypothetical protein H0H93_008101 [Arthromyces matolae]
MTLKPRSKWNVTCDSILVGCLLDQRADGKQTGNGGFHSSAWTAAKVLLAGSEVHSKGSEKTPQSCQNRYNALKKDYKEVKHLRSLSGFGWDEEKNLVTAAEDVWTALLTAHPSYEKWRTTSFPPFDEMADLIEGTYATGKGVVRPGREQTPSDGSDSGDEDLSFIDPVLLADVPSQAAPTSPPPPSISTTSSSQPTPMSSQASGSNSPSNSLRTPAPVGPRVRHSRKVSGTQAIEGMATSINRLAEAVSNDAAVPSPIRKRQAIHLIEDDGDLSDDEQIKVIKIIRRDTSFADTILAIRKAESRTRYIKSELYPLDEDVSL